MLILSEIWSNNVTIFNNLFSGYNFYYDLAGNVGGVGLSEVIYHIIILIIIKSLAVMNV